MNRLYEALTFTNTLTPFLGTGGSSLYIVQAFSLFALPWQTASFLRMRRGRDECKLIVLSGAEWFVSILSDRSVKGRL